MDTYYYYVPTYLDAKQVDLKINELVPDDKSEAGNFHSSIAHSLL